MEQVQEMLSEERLRQFIGNVPFEQIQGRIEHVIETAASIHYEDTALQFLTLYQAALTVTYESLSGVSRQLIAKYQNLSAYRAFLKNLYWQFPQDVSVLGQVEPRFFAAKQFVLKEIVESWEPDVSSASIDMFRFVIAAHGHERSHQGSSSEWEQKARGRLVAVKTQQLVLTLMRDWIAKRVFSAHALEQWIMQPLVPEEITKVLMHAWVRTAKATVMIKHLKRSHLISEYETSVEESPKEVQNAIREWSDALYQAGKDVAKFISDVRSLFCSNADVSYSYPLPNQVAVVVINNRNHTDVTNYALACSVMHVAEKYSNKELRLQKFLVDLTVRSRDGDGEEYHHQFTIHDWC